MPPSNNDVLELPPSHCRLGASPVGPLLGSGIPALLTAPFDVEIPVSPLSVAFALGLSAEVGIFFGHYPARRALWPESVQALRCD